jgi:hypothetical protein
MIVNFCFFRVEREVCFVLCITELVNRQNRTLYLEAVKHFLLLISLLVRHGRQKQGEHLVAGERNVSESVNKVVRFEDPVTVSVKMAV